MTAFAALRPVEPAPAARRLTALAACFAVAFAVLGVQAMALALRGQAAPGGVGAVAEQLAPRADLVDRNGVLLAADAPSFTLLAHPPTVWDAPSVAKQVAKVLPTLDQRTLTRRLTSGRDEVVLAWGLSQRERDALFAKGLPGLSFREELKRVYPQAASAAHLLGGAHRDRSGAGGLEKGLEPVLRGPSPVATSIDVRAQHALEAVLASGATASRARGAGGVVVDGWTGEVLALASWPSFDPNAPPSPDDPRRLNLVTQALFDPGSVVKPFVVAAALEAGLVGADEVFPVEHLQIAGREIRDPHPAPGPMTLKDALARSSNVVAATLALRLGPERLLDAYARAGLTQRPETALPGIAEPQVPRAPSRLDAAVMGYGHAFTTPLLAVAGAYTAFCNDGARVGLTFTPRPDPRRAPRVAVFQPVTNQAMLRMLEAVVSEGTGRGAAHAAVSLAGKTGTAEKVENGAYREDKVVASFVAVFPAQAPRYVVAIALDEPNPTAESGGLATGGALAAPMAARLAARIAPFLDLVPGAASQKAHSAEGELSL